MTTGAEFKSLPPETFDGIAPHILETILDRYTTLSVEQALASYKLLRQCGMEASKAHAAVIATMAMHRDMIMEERDRLLATPIASLVPSRPPANG